MQDNILSRMHSPMMSGKNNNNRKQNNSQPKVSNSQVYNSTPTPTQGINVTSFNKYSISKIKDNFDSSNNNNRSKTEKQPLKKKPNKQNGLKPIKNIHLISQVSQDESYDRFIHN